ncbi:MAG TPA: coenzyme F420-0:L-glutamate ligase [Terriglobales bacterium]|nr:coenzyme F420-0:L-glutamate ligase [Terriglobales bacterium]
MKPTKQAEIRAIPIQGLPEIRPGDSVADKLFVALKKQKLRLAAGDILVIKHKIISKAEGRVVPLATIKPSAAADQWAAEYGLDPRVIELALRESTRVVRQQNGVLITETRHGLVCANSGVDVSNVDGGQSAVLLPEDPDRSAETLHRDLQSRLRLSIPVIISDSFGRPWREGLSEVAIGLAGLVPLVDYRGQRDPDGYELHASVEAVADELACLAGLVCGKLARVPACIIRGFNHRPGRGRASQLLRPAARDLFR